MFGDFPATETLGPRQFWHQPTKEITIVTTLLLVLLLLENRTRCNLSTVKDPSNY